MLASPPAFIHSLGVFPAVVCQRPGLLAALDSSLLSPEQLAQAPGTEALDGN